MVSERDREAGCCKPCEGRLPLPRSPSPVPSILLLPSTTKSPHTGTRLSVRSSSTHRRRKPPSSSSLRPLPCLSDPLTRPCPPSSHSPPSRCSPSLGQETSTSIAPFPSLEELLVVEGIGSVVASRPEEVLVLGQQVDHQRRFARRIRECSWPTKVGSS